MFRAWAAAARSARLLDRKLDIAVSARLLKPAEEAGGLRQFVALRTAFVLATSARSPNGLKVDDLPRVFASDNATWADGSPMRLILRPRSEADNELFARMMAGMDKAIEAARQRAEVPVAATDQDNADLAEKMPGSAHRDNACADQDRAAPFAGNSARWCCADLRELRERKISLRKPF